MAAEQEPPTVHRNEVLLGGRLSTAAQERELPSGDLVVTFRLVIDRPAGSRARARASVDALECSAFRADVRRRALAWSPGDVVQVEGSLRRRFWRSPSGPTSRGEVEVERARRVATGGTRADGAERRVTRRATGSDG